MAERAVAYRGLFWLAPGLHEADLRYYRPDRYTTAPVRAEAVKAAPLARIDHRTIAKLRQLRLVKTEQHLPGEKNVTHLRLEGAVLEFVPAQAQPGTEALASPTVPPRVRPG